MGLPATQSCQLGTGAHKWSDLIITNPWYLWFRPIRGVLACPCEIQCDSQADVYGMVGGSHGSGPFFACDDHWSWLGTNHHISGGHYGAVLSAGPDRHWGGTIQNYDPAWMAEPGRSTPKTPGEDETPDHRSRIFDEFVASDPSLACQAISFGGGTCARRPWLAGDFRWSHAGTDGVVLVSCPRHWQQAEANHHTRGLLGWWDGERWRILARGELPTAAKAQRAL